MKTLRKWYSVPVACITLLVPILVAGTLDIAPAGAAGGPSCTFNGGTLPLVTGVTEGGTVQVNCTGLPPLHPYIFLETSLVVAIDPSTSSLLTGGVSPGSLLSVLEALPLINVAGIDFVFSDLSGNLDYSYRTPTSQALDPNASCPPSTEEINSGLIGCALALVDLTSATEVSGANALLEYQGSPLLPPSPTLALTPKHAAAGQVVTVHDKKGATTYWWTATLASLTSDLGGPPPPPPTIKVKISKVPGGAADNVAITPATYNGITFTPPVLSGTFTVPPSAAPGKHTVKVVYEASVDGLLLATSATATITVTSP